MQGKCSINCAHRTAEVYLYLTKRFFLVYDTDSFMTHCRYGLTDKQPAEEFLFVHQTAWQRRLLSLYGSNICIMDATYRTSKYALPLFFICVPTNVGHSIVGSFLVSSESKVSIMEGLRKLQQWNPDWAPRAFITDFDEREIQAIEEVFSG